MNAKEKAKELMSKFVGISLSQVNELVDGIRIRLAKESALIAVEEIINSRIEYNDFWNDVKSELQSF